MPLDPNSTTPDGNTDIAPAWRRKFPIDTAKDADNSRREFVAGTLVAGGAMACCQVAFNAATQPDEAAKSSAKLRVNELPVREHGELILPKKFQEMEVGEAQLFHYPDERSPSLLVKLDATEFSAFTQKCTHLACPVVPDLDHKEFHCPCHHGSFDLRTGEPLAGPPRSALTRVEVQRLEDGTLKVIGILS